MPDAESLPLARNETPTDPAAVVALVKDAYRDGVPVYPIGGGTSLDFGVPPTRQGVGLSLAGLTDVVDFPARDLTITAQAGVTLGDLSARLAGEGLRLPVDISQAQRATLGGVVACSPSGPRRYGWGTMRDYVIGLSAVDGCGALFCGGGRVVKNAAGYDLCRLMTGSLGTLGVITQVTLMVKPIPQTSALVACEVPDLATAERLLAEMIQSKVLPVAVELLVGKAWHDAPGLGPGWAGGLPCIVAGLEGTEAEVEWMVEQLCSQWRASGARAPATATGAEAEPLWSCLTEFPTAGADDSGASLVARISVLPSRVTAMVRQLQTIDPDCSVESHAGSGVMRVRFSWEPDQMVARLQRELRPAVESAEGHMVVLACPAGAGLLREAAWGPLDGGYAVMQSIKEKYDPKNILNPGRFIFPD